VLVQETKRNALPAIERRNPIGPPHSVNSAKNRRKRGADPCDEFRGLNRTIGYPSAAAHDFLIIWFVGFVVATAPLFRLTFAGRQGGRQGDESQTKASSAEAHDCPRRFCSIILSPSPHSHKSAAAGPPRHKFRLADDSGSSGHEVGSRLTFDSLRKGSSVESKLYSSFPYSAHSEDDQIVPYVAAGPLSAKLLRNSTFKSYKNFPHGMPTTEAATINADLLAFLKRSKQAAA
jgi:hypothetical protein